MGGIVWAAVAGISFGLFQAVSTRARRTVDPFTATFIVLLVCSVALGAVTIATQDWRHLAAVPLTAVGWFALAGGAHFFLGWTFLGLSQHYIGASRTTVITGTTPLFGTLIAFLVLREVVRPTVLVGVALVVVGVLILAFRRRSGSTTPGRGNTYGLILSLLTALCWGLSPLFVRLGFAHVPSPIVGVTIGMASSTLVYGVLLVVRGRASHRTLTPGAVRWLVAAGMLVGIGTAAQWIAYDLAPVAVVLALSQLAVPVVLLSAPAVVGGTAEAPSIRTIAGAALVVAGTLLIIFSRTPS